MRFLIALPLCSALMLMSGCATVTRGTTDTLVVESEPSGAQVILSNGMTGQTPTAFKLSRKDAVVVEIKKEGYEPIKVNVQPQISGGGSMGMAGNVLVGGLVGAAIDAGSGAMNDLKPNPIKVKLVPLPQPEPLDTRSYLERLKAQRDSGAISESEYRRKRAEILKGL